MTQAFLQSELTSLISDSKRRYNDIRTAAEQSLSDLKAISVTSEPQLAGDLLRRLQFIDPFVLACKSKNVKLASSATICLQRLAASKAIPRPRLSDVCEAFQEAVTTGYDAQLKVLQTLPSLLQLYAADIEGELLARTLELCTALQTSKTAIVSNTAAATFQQLISTVFEQTGRSPLSRTSNSGDIEEGEAGDSGQRTTSEDAAMLFDDFCALLDQQAPIFLRVESISLDFLLETMETIFNSYGSFVMARPKQVMACQQHLLPGLVRLLSRKDHFGLVARALRIVYVLTKRYTEQLRSSLLPALQSILAGLEREANPPWKRALCMEFFRDLFSDFNVVRTLFELFDGTGDHDTVISALMASFVRIAAEDPSLIGLGRQSTVPVQRVNDVRSEEAASIEAQGLGGAITSVSTADFGTTGISMDWSVVATKLLDQVDRAAPPTMPTTYLYSLVLGTVAAFCDGLSKYVMPLSVPSRNSRRESTEGGQRDSTDAEGPDDTGRRRSRPTIMAHKYHRLTNPLMLSGNPHLESIKTCAKIIEACWPAALATCSTFLNSALDANFYHVLIRSVQKLAQVSGVLELATPRDALLTTLAKSSIPPNARGIVTGFQNARASRTATIDEEGEGAVSTGLKSPTEAPQTPIIQAASPPLNVRHLLCMRALLNLGIALGPTLEQEPWFILIETLQQVEALISMPITLAATLTKDPPQIGTTSSEGQATLATEISAVQSATKRLLESTRGYSSESFIAVVNALFRLLGQTTVDGTAIKSEIISSPVSPGPGLGMNAPQHGRKVSGLWTKSKSLELECGFVLGKVSELSRVNLHRFASNSQQKCSWELICATLLRLSRARDITRDHRIQAASILDLIAMETMKLLDDPGESLDEADEIRARCLRALVEQLELGGLKHNNLAEDVDFEIHKRVLEALESMLSHSGESLGNCWPEAMQILTLTKTGRQSVAGVTDPASGDDDFDEDAQLLRVAFRSIQMITSDFLNILPPPCLNALAQLIRRFGSQDYDINVALTSTTLLWNLASQILNQIDAIDIDTMPPSTGVSNLSSSFLGDFDPTALWATTLLQLVHLCMDGRVDVRNAAIKVLLKMLEASSQSLTPSGWAVTILNGPLTIIEFGIKQRNADGSNGLEWMKSSAELTDGTIELISLNLGIISQHQGFQKTWCSIIDLFEIILTHNTLSASALAFSNLSRLLTAMLDSKIPSPELRTLVEPVLRLWSSHHPANIARSEGLEGTAASQNPQNVPNQAAFAAHMHLFVRAYRTCPEAIKLYRKDDESSNIILMRSIEQTVTLSTHPPYTSDTKILSAEQIEIVEGLSILKDLLVSNLAVYSQYLLHLLKAVLLIKDGRVGLKKPSTISKAVQKPTFIALSSTCLEILRGLVRDLDQSGDVFELLSVHESLIVLSAIIDTKYRSIPNNTQAPLWRSATETAVTLLEAVVRRIQNSQLVPKAVDIHAAAAAIIPVATNIVAHGGLAMQIPKISNDALEFDLEFDVSRFQQMHQAVVSIFQSPAVEESLCRQYAFTLFNTSLLFKPWFHDFPPDTYTNPLDDLLKPRPGSVHIPVLALRPKMCYATLNALFELVSRQPTGEGDLSKLACAAAPYLLLRVVHPIKTFLSDQRLRGLMPPEMDAQVELQTTLEKFVGLHSDPVTFDDFHVRPDEYSHGQTGAPQDEIGHLRLLYPLLLQLQRFWTSLPRLREGAWQSDGPGRGIEIAIREWAEAIGGSVRMVVR